MTEPTTMPSTQTLERLLVEGDLSALNTAQRLDYYTKVCESLGLNPLTQPFEYIKLNGKLRLYAKRDCCEQLRKLYGISVSGMHFETVGDIYVVRADFIDKSGRTDQSTGAVPIKGLTGEALANAFMKAETKCKRRGTLSICGLGMLDETEVQSVQEIEAAAQKKFPRLRGQKATPTPLTALEPRTMIDLLDPVMTAIDESTPTVGEEPADVAGSGEAGGYPEGESAALDGPAVADLVTEAEVRALEGIIRDRAKEKKIAPGLYRDKVKQYCGAEYGVEHFRDLPRAQYLELRKLLKAPA